MIGLDGWIRFWFYETIDDADLPSEKQLLEIQPIYEFHITEGKEYSNRSAMLMSIQKQEPNDPEKTIWYAQVNISHYKNVTLLFNKICDRMEMEDCGYLIFAPIIDNSNNKKFLHAMLVP